MFRTTMCPSPGRPKHVELINTVRKKGTKKNCAPSWLYLQDYTGMQVNKI